MYSEEVVRYIASWLFHFSKTNEFSDDELEEKLSQVLEQIFKKNK